MQVKSRTPSASNYPRKQSLFLVFSKIINSLILCII